MERVMKWGGLVVARGWPEGRHAGGGAGGGRPWWSPGRERKERNKEKEKRGESVRVKDRETD